MIKILKINNQIFHNFNEKSIDEQGNETWNIPQDLEDFKSLAIDTLNWQIGQAVLKKAGGKQVDLSASNSKAIALIVKLLDALTPNLDNLTPLEKDSYNNLLALANSGYSDSEKLKKSTEAVAENIAKYTDKIQRVTQAKTHDEVIEILNED
jgi:hypothetical protein